MLSSSGALVFVTNVTATKFSHGRHIILSPEKTLSYKSCVFFQDLSQFKISASNSKRRQRRNNLKRSLFATLLVQIVGNLEVVVGLLSNDIMFMLRFARPGHPHKHNVLKKFNSFLDSRVA
jgi:hypothetical protein